MGIVRQKTVLSGNRGRGTVLIVTLWIVFALASLVIVFSQMIRVEALAAANNIAAVQAEAVAAGAIQYVLARINLQDSSVNYNVNPYEAVRVGDGYFWALRPNLSDDRKYDFGIVDEGGKININAVSLDVLLKLPGMTSELANSIIDWRDSDQEISPGGAESEYYLLLDNPYYCKDSALESPEEVLMIKGGDKTALYGEDYNRNGVLDWNENDAQVSPPADNANGRLDAGFYNYITVFSYEQAGGGQPLINVNNVRSQGQLANLIREVVGDDYYNIMNHIRLQRRYNNLIELYYVSGMKYEDFNKIIGKLTTSDRKRVAGLVNVNTASASVLNCLPGLEKSDVDALIQKRSSLNKEELSGILWITKALDREKAIQAGSYITVKSSQYSADIVAVDRHGRAFRRFFVVIDTAGDYPRVIYKQPMHHLGWPLSPDILEKLRSGAEI